MIYHRYFILLIVFFTYCPIFNIFAHNIIPLTSGAKVLIKDTNNSFKSISFIKLIKQPIFKKPIRFLDGIISSNESIDFTGDHKKDFIIKLKPDSLGLIKEYWVNTDFSIIKKVFYSSNIFHYRWFINLDSDPEPEIIEAIGDSSYANFMVVDQQLHKGIDSVLFYFKPIIIDNGKQFWNNHKNIKNIYARTNGSSVKILCATNPSNNTILSDILAIQKKMPILFFTGKQTLYQETYNIKNKEWLSIKDILIRFKN